MFQDKLSTQLDVSSGPNSEVVGKMKLKLLALYTKSLLSLTFGQRNVFCRSTFQKLSIPYILCLSFLDVVDQTLRHEGVLVKVHKVGDLQIT